MTPDPYDDPFALDPPPAPAPAERPIRKPSRPYGIQPVPAGLVREPGAPVGAPPAVPTPPPAAAPRPPASGRSPDKPLPRRREAFCQAFVVRGNATRAAQDAGYSVLAAANQGYRLLRRADVQARIAAIHRAMGAGANRDADVLLGKLEAVYRRAVDGGYLNAAARIVELQARMAGRLDRAAAEKTRNDDK